MTPRDLAVLSAPGGWEELLRPESRSSLEAALPAYIAPRRWFGAKTQRIEGARVVEAIAVPTSAGNAYLTLVRLAYAGGGGDTYALPLLRVPGPDADQWLSERPHAVVARVNAGDGAGLLVDALFEPAFCAALLDLIAEGRSVSGEAGELRPDPTDAFARLRGDASVPLAPKVGAAEQSNTSVIYGGRLIMKLFRKVEPGINPDLEIGRFLTERAAFAHSPPTAGTIEYRAPGSEPVSLALLQGFVPNQGDAWSYTLLEIARSFRQALAAQRPPADDGAPPPSLLELAAQEPTQRASDAVGGFLSAAGLLGKRTAALHRALAADADEPAFAPEPFDDERRAALSDTLAGRAAQSFQALRSRLADLPEQIRGDGQKILGAERDILERLQRPLGQPLAALRARIHGDYHLGQVLFTGEDFFIIDFEGEPARPLADRRVKSSPLQDVAGMLRSFHYAPYAVLLGQAPGVAWSDDERRALAPWAREWQRGASAAFLRSYLAELGPSPLIPSDPAELGALLDVYLLDKALYELAYELNNRPDWAAIPIEGILQLVGVTSDE